jgi:hypothetical protein
MGSRTPTDRSREARQRAWRDVNGNIALLADRLSNAIGDGERAWTFMCECGDADCREMLTVELEAYRAARAVDQFLVALGHDTPGDRVVERHDDYLVVELV